MTSSRPARWRSALTFVAPALVVPALGACGPQIPSTARLVTVTYTPSAEGGSVEETSLSYDDNGRPERAETEVDGVEVYEEVFTFDDEGKLEQIETEQKDGLSLTNVLTYEWSDGRIVSVSGEGTGVRDPQGDNILYTTSSDRNLEYDDQGRLSEVTLDSVLHLSQTVTIPILNIDIVYEVTSSDDVTDRYDWNDQGELTELSTARSNTTLYEQDDEETGRSTETETRTLGFGWEDGKSKSLELALSVTSVEGDTTTESTGTATLDIDLNDDGQVSGVDESYVDNGTTSSDSLDVEYDEEGRITSLENADGDRWEFEYDDEPVSGVTFRSARMPVLFDMAGRASPGTVGSPTHLGY